MNTKLITALRTAARAIEDGVFDYNWREPSRCNCGVVVCALFGVSAQHLRTLLREENLRPAEDPTWARIVGQNCPITGVPQSILFQHLYRFGFTAKEIKHLEDLSRTDILLRAGLTHSRPEREDASRLTKYLRAWADILTEEGAGDIPEHATPPLQSVSS